MKTLSSEINKLQCSDFYKITNSIAIDKNLLHHEIQVQRKWLKSLLDGGYLIPSEYQQLCNTLESIFQKMRAGSFDWQEQDEDIHMNIERSLTETLGDLGKKIHLGRSRNDLVATTLALYSAEKADEIVSIAVNLSRTLIKIAKRDLSIVVPGYTHSQAALPLRISHLWNCHAINFKNDAINFKRLADQTRALLPLGSGALSGTHLQIDLQALAKDLGFHNATVNSIYTTSNRDYLIEISQGLAIFGLHITKLCEDIIFYTSSNRRALALSANWSSGSSMMPNKRNPDFFEIIRANAKSMIHLSSEVMAVNVGLGSGYSSDLQNQKGIFIKKINEILQFLTTLPRAFESISPHIPMIENILTQGHLLATDRANRLVENGMNFRDAYRKIAAEILHLDGQGQQIGIECDSKSPKEILTKLSEEAVEKRNNCGGTAYDEVLKTIHSTELELRNIEI